MYFVALRLGRSLALPFGVALVFMLLPPTLVLVFMCFFARFKRELR